jgi:hypothetical protein
VSACPQDAAEEESWDEEGEEEEEARAAPQAVLPRARHLSHARALTCLVRFCPLQRESAEEDGEEDEEVTVFFDVAITKPNDQTLLCAHAARSTHGCTVRKHARA